MTEQEIIDIESDKIESKYGLDLCWNDLNTDPKLPNKPYIRFSIRGFKKWEESYEGGYSKNQLMDYFVEAIRVNNQLLKGWVIIFEDYTDQYLMTNEFDGYREV